jgi:hypothetical protein
VEEVTTDIDDEVMTVATDLNEIRLFDVRWITRIPDTDDKTSRNI